MPYVDYSLVPNAIRGLTKDIRGVSADERAHRERMAGLDFQNAQLGLRKTQMQNEQEIALAKQQRENFLNEPVTLEKAIQDHPKMSPQQKAYSLQFISKQLPKESVDYVLRGMIMPRKDWQTKANEAVMQTRTAMEEKAYRDRMLALKERELSMRAKTQGKDTRGSFTKKVDDIYNTRSAADPKFTREDALNEALNNENLSNRIRLFDAEAKIITNRYDLKDDEKARLIEKRRKILLGDVANGKVEEDKQLTLPENIKKASEAMSYLKEQGLTDEQAKDWLRDYMSK